MKLSYVFVVFLSTLFLWSCSFDSSGLKATNNENNNNNNTPLCGNSIKEDGEICDGTDIPLTCTDLGYSGGTLSCTADCKADTSLCTGVCGECTPDAKQCKDNSVYECVKDNMGCGKWVINQDCSSTSEFCITTGTDVACESTCTDQCSAGEFQCSSDNLSVEACKAVTSGDSTCLLWQTSQICDSDETCSQTANLAKCAADCTTGDKKCSSDNTSVLICGIDSDGFTEWQTDEACVSPAECITENGDSHCETCHICTPDELRCSADTLKVEICVENQSTGCTSWQTSQTCQSGSVCNNPSDPACNSCVTCHTGDNQCSLNYVSTEVCTEGINGCTSWQTDIICQTDYKCDPNSYTCSLCSLCTVGDTRCSSDLTGIEKCEVVDSDRGCTDWNLDSNCDPAKLEICSESSPSSFTCVHQGNTCSDPYVITTDDFTYQTTTFESDFGNDINFTCNPSSTDKSDVFFSLDLTEGDQIEFNESGDFDTTLRILSSCAQDACLASDDDWAPIIFNAPYSGTYYFVVEASDGVSSSTDTEIHIKKTQDICDMNETEPNNVLSTANSSLSSYPGVFCSTFFTSDDRDCVHINIPSQGANISLYTSSAFDDTDCSDADTILDFFDSDGQLLLKDDDNGIIWCSAISDSNYDFADHVPAGDYVACVRTGSGYTIDHKMALSIDMTNTDKSILLNHDFITFLPAGWTTDKASNSGVTPPGGWAQGTGDGIFGTNHYARIETPGSGHVSTYYYAMHTPPFDLSGYSHAVLRFLERSDRKSSVYSSIYIKLGDANWEEIPGTSSSSDYEEWTVKTIDLSDYAGNASVRLGFVLTDEWNNEDSIRYWELDNIMVYAY